jgi:hypothetical protein
MSFGLPIRGGFEESRAGAGDLFSLRPGIGSRGPSPKCTIALILGKEGLGVSPFSGTKTKAVDISFCPSPASLSTIGLGFSILESNFSF